MTKLLIISDIHLPTRISNFPHAKILPYTKNIDLICGLGDYVNQQALDELFGFGLPVKAVAGNMDSPLLQNSLPQKIVFDLKGINIGLIHGFGAPFYIREKIYNEFAIQKGNKIDLICYGHTHSPYWGKINDTFFFNPGSLSNDQPTLGIISIDNGEISPEIIEL